MTQLQNMYSGNKNTQKLDRKSYRVVYTRHGKYQICLDLFYSKLENLFTSMNNKTFPRRGTEKKIVDEIVSKAVPRSEADIYNDEIIKVGV